MLRKTLKMAGWSVAGVVAALAVAYGVLLAINWRDRPPSATAARFEQMYSERSPVPDADNAFVFLLGFGVAPGQDVRAMGIRRLQWFSAANGMSTWDPSGDPLPDAYEYAKDRTIAVREFSAACASRERGCVERFDSAADIHAEWIASERWLLERYEGLIAHPHWREVVPEHSAAFATQYAAAMEGQKLLLVHARVLIDRHDYAEVRGLLESDVRFWRMVLASSDILITKMIAVAALNRHFELGDLVLRAAPRDQVAAVMPTQWRDPLTTAELSMERCIVGEWMFAASTLRTLVHGDARNRAAAGSANPFDFLAKPFFQYQDTRNRHAERLAEIVTVLDVPLDRYPASMDRLVQLQQGDAGDGVSFTAYNPIGHWLLGVGFTNFAEYAARVGDAEGVRRAALTAVELRAAALNGEQVPQALARHAARNPYTHESFVWDAQSGSIVFHGLDKRVRGEHRIRY